MLSTNPCRTTTSFFSSSARAPCVALLHLPPFIGFCLLELGCKSRISTEDCDPPYVLEPTGVRRTPRHRDFDRRCPFPGVVWRVQGAVKSWQCSVKCFIDKSGRLSHGVRDLICPWFHRVAVAPAREVCFFMCGFFRVSERVGQQGCDLRLTLLFGVKPRDEELLRVRSGPVGWVC